MPITLKNLLIKPKEYLLDYEKFSQWLTMIYNSPFHKGGEYYDIMNIENNIEKFDFINKNFDMFIDHMYIEKNKIYYKPLTSKFPLTLNTYNNKTYNNCIKDLKKLLIILSDKNIIYDEKAFALIRYMKNYCVDRTKTTHEVINFYDINGEHGTFISLLLAAYDELTNINLGEILISKEKYLKEYNKFCKWLNENISSPFHKKEFKNNKEVKGRFYYALNYQYKIGISEGNYCYNANRPANKKKQCSPNIDKFIYLLNNFNRFIIHVENTDKPYYRPFLGKFADPNCVEDTRDLLLVLSNENSTYEDRAWELLEYMRRYCVPTGNNKIIKPIEFFTKKGESGTFLSLLFAAYIDLTNIDKREAKKAIAKAKREHKKANPKPKRPTKRKSPKQKSPVAIAPAPIPTNSDSNTNVNNAVTTVKNGNNTNANNNNKRYSPELVFGNFSQKSNKLNSPNNK
jgi:hypothetical protein